MLAVAAGACAALVAVASGAAVCGSLEVAAPSVFSGTLWALSVPALVEFGGGLIGHSGDLFLLRLVVLPPPRTGQTDHHKQHQP